MSVAHDTIFRKATDVFVVELAGRAKGLRSWSKSWGTGGHGLAWQSIKGPGRMPLDRLTSYHDCFITTTLTDVHTSDVEKADRIFRPQPASRGK